MMWDHGWSAGNWLVMSFAMLVFWAALIGVIAWVVRSHRPTDGDANRARQILDERYARGEINDDEYKQRRDQLGIR
jgi:putative membrane protein